MSTVESTARERGGCLTAFLILMLITNPLTGIYYLVAGSTVRQMFPAMQDWAIPAFVLLSVANVIFAIGIWKWKRWGVFGFAATSLITFLINTISIGILPALFGLIGLVILAILVRPVWTQME